MTKPLYRRGAFGLQAEKKSDPFGSLFFVSSDKVRYDAFFFCREAVGFFAEGDAFHQEGHVACEGAHHVEAFAVLFCVICVHAVDAVPVTACGDGHTADGEVFVELVEGGGQTSAACGGDCGTDFHRFVERRAEEEAGEECVEGGVGGGVIHRAAHHQAVAGLKFRGKLVDRCC